MPLPRIQLRNHGGPTHEAWQTEPSQKARSPKHSLSLPDLDQARSAVLNSIRSKETQRGYRHAIDEFVAWYCSEPRLSFKKAVVTRYRTTWNRVNSRRPRSTPGSRP